MGIDPIPDPKPGPKSQPQGAKTGRNEAAPLSHPAANGTAGHDADMRATISLPGHLESVKLPGQFRPVSLLELQ